MKDYLALALLLVSGAAYAEPEAEKNNLHCSYDVAQAQKLIVNKQGDNAMEEILAPTIAELDALEKEDGRRFYCARSSAETLAYLTTAATEDQEAVVVDQQFADALYFAAYVDIEHRDLGAATKKLQRAHQLSPFNANYLCELGYLAQIQRLWPASLDYYERAIEAAESFSPEAVRTSELGRAMRGKGYALIETGKLNEAEAIYQACLELNPDDINAKRERQYIQQLRVQSNN